MQKRGFSLMEMMVVMLIVAIIAAATAPMINKKMIQNASGDSPWIWTSALGNSIAFNINGSANSPAVIGAVTQPNGLSTRLHINSDSNTPLITFTDSNNNTSDGSLKLRYRNDNTVRSVSLNTSTSLFDQSVLLGAGIASFASRTVAVGTDIKALMTNNVLVGSDTVASGNAVAVGNSARASANAVSIGAFNDTSDTSTAVSNSYAIRIGTNARTPGLSSIAIGGAYKDSSNNKNYTKASGAYSIALGAGASVSAQNSQPQNAIAIGATTSAEADNSIAIGGIYTSGSGNSQVSQRVIASGAYSIALGAGAETNGSHTIAIGENAKVKSDTNKNTYSSVAIGVNSLATRENSIAVGGDTEVTGVRSIAIGNQAKVVRSDTDNSPDAIEDGIAIGYTAKANSSGAIALGRDTTAGGLRSVAIGSTFSNQNAIASGVDSVAIGTSAQALHNNSTAIGVGAKTRAANQIVLGDENTTVYIPGHFIVDKNVVISRREGYPAYYKMWRQSSSGWHEVRPIDTADSDRYQDLQLGAEPYIDKTSGPDNFDFDFEKMFPSDRRLKDVGEVFRAGLEEVKKLEVFNFTYKKDPNKTPRVGVMAQDLEKIFPKAVFKGDDGFLRIRMEDMFYAVVNAVKELDVKLTALVENVKTNIADITDLKIKSAEYEKTIAELVEQNKAQAKALKDLEKRLAKLEKKNLKKEVLEQEEVVIEE